MRFVAVDVETANPDLASVCQIGVVVFETGQVLETWQSLINPQDYFDPFNVAVHGIREQDVIGAPTISQVYARLIDLLAGQVVAHHTAFDRTAFSRIATKHQLSEIECSWLDTAKVARRAWPELATTGYGLANIARSFGITFRHHAAHEDARAAGEIFLRAIAETGLLVSEWVDRVRQPIHPTASGSRQGNRDGPLTGETVVFTGAMSLSRQRVADLAAEAGCDVASGVTKQMTLLVVGDQDARMLAGHEKSAKHRKAEELRTKGQSIRILAESDFLHLCEVARPPAFYEAADVKPD